jgi:hypothetical protein
MWLPIFLVGSVWFFALVGVVCIALLVAIETESPFWAALTLVGFCCAMHFFGDFNAFGWALDNPFETLSYVGGYFAAGAFWSVCKWWFFVRNKRDKYNEVKYNFIRDNKLKIGVKDVMPAENRKDFRTLLRHTDTSMPEARQNKSRIMTWMTYWPWSMVWTMINDPIKKLFRMLYLRMQRIYEKISESIWSGVEEDLAVEPTPPNYREPGEVDEAA